MWKLTLFCSMLRLMDAAESLSTTDWKLLTDVLLLGLAESGDGETGQPAAAGKATRRRPVQRATIHANKVRLQVFY